MIVLTRGATFLSRLVNCHCRKGLAKARPFSLQVGRRVSPYHSPRCGLAAQGSRNIPCGPERTVIRLTTHPDISSKLARSI